MAREMKDSGIEWVGMIPKEWNVTKIKFLCEMQSGDSITAQDINIEKDEINCYEVYGANGFRGYYKDYTHNGRYCLVGRQGALAGNVHIVDSTFWATDHAVVVYVNNKVSQEYMYYLLTSMNLNQYAYETAAQPGLSVSKIMNLQVICPPYIQQQIILEHLNKECAEIDATSSDIQSQIHILEDYKKSVITEAVTKGLNPDVEMKDSGIEWIKEMPISWHKARIGYNSWIRARLGWKGLKAEEYVDSGYAFLSAFNIINNRLKWEGLNYINQERYDESPEIKLHVGDIILVKDGAGIGKCARIDALPVGESTTNGSLAVISTYNCLDYRYLYYYLQSSIFQNYIFRIMNGMGVPHLSQEELRKIVIPMPPKNIQVEIADFLDEKCIEIDVMIEEKIKQIDVLEKYKKSLIYEYVTGKKEVPNNNG